ncbi:uncharacterized protein MYCFIDRAFT_41337 [Pseudocercospora fijiensis CIRAD86]|uniref:U3 small nucleolar RNA-associated protein 10 n=1 Tax=Pseudocercospora fijiensis (strain CIRAD86) TaxID=383855 RepID=M3ALS8_PSEFD|nr:uncharacterized protein MYCFIDRAFT_41337 [Pseudocercospora fijiensis CIRAD86]EME85551.1 hypothetical protein MYCFIDRAFT_41337 [Pseudocercospora fijiensis CIRAD86]
MATALQQQLAAIAANSTHQLDLKAQKARHAKSLLFDPRDASTQTFDTIHQLCLEGFEELCQLDARFIPFSRSLFSEQSKSEDRTSMTAKENAELDKVIERFLALLGGRLLLKPAMKAAEWLVRRFRVQEYNTEAVLFAFLPYHSSPIFTALLSILPHQLPPTFRFLHPYVTQQAQNPPRHAIVMAASNVSAFFTAFSQHVLSVAQAKYHSALLLGFWASITAQAVNAMIDATRSGRETVRRQKEEDLLLKLLPILQSALGIKGVPELYLGSCMIMTIVATKASLADKVLNAMMEAVATAWTEQIVEDGIVCLSVLAEEKQQLLLSKPTFRALLDEAELLLTIEHVGAKYRVDKLLTGIAVSAIDGLTQGECADASALLTDLLKSDALPEEGKLLVLENAITQASQLQPSGGQAIVAAVTRSVSENEVAGLLQQASQKAGINLAQLDSDLALQIQQGAMESEAEAEPEPMLIDHDVEIDANESNLSLGDLPALPSKDSSFLEVKHERLFGEYASAFQKVSLAKRDLETLLNAPALQKSSAFEQPNLLSFLARVWTSELPSSTKSRALQIARDLFEQFVLQDHVGDLQALIPYLISALADSASSVRNAAAAACISLEAIYRTMKKSKADAKVWAKDDVYGKESSTLHWLTHADAHKILSDALLPILEDCVVDQTYVGQALTDIINAPSSAARSDRKELKQASRAALFSNLASHVVLTPVVRVKLSLLEILKKVGKTAGSSRTQILLPYIKHYFSQLASPANHKASRDLCKMLLANVSSRSSDEVQFLKALAIGEVTSVTECCALGFSRLRHLWSSMKEAAQDDLVGWLVSLSLDSGASQEVQTGAVETLRALQLPTRTLVQLVETLPSVPELQSQPPSAKKRRTSDVIKSGSIDKQKLHLAIKRITFVLELVEGAKPEKHPQLLEGLFYILSELHHYKSSLESELVYLQGLLINNLLSVVNGLVSSPFKDVDKSVIRADLIVECVRTTSSTQVHQAALLLMSALASWAPDLVLHSVMPLFTFMSATILKQGDDYSAHVTDQTVSQIIPPLAASLKKRGRDLISGAAELLLSFTAAFEHIPLHRRAGLFHNLVETLGANESLSAIVAMLIERYPEDPTALSFVSSLMERFAPSTQLVAVQRILDLVFDTLRAKRGLSDTILGYAEKTAEQATASTAVLLEGLASTLSNGALRKLLAKELKKGGDGADALRNNYSVILERAMQLELQLKAHGQLSDSATNVLTSLLGLMPTSDFIEASGTLMQAGSDEIRRQVFWSLEQRVKAAKRGDTALQKIFIELLPQCALFVAQSQPVQTRLAAIKCIDCIADRFGKTDRASLFRVAQQIAGQHALGAGSGEQGLRMTSVLCLASMIEVLGDEFIPILPKSLETITQYMDEAYRNDEDEEDIEMLDAGFSFGLAVLDHIPWMLSGQHLNRLLALAAASGETQALSFSSLAAKKLSADSFLASLRETWEEVVTLSIEQDEDAALRHVGALRQAVQHYTKATVSKNFQVLSELLLQAHDLRRILTESDAENDTTSLSELVNSTTMDTVLKLNDATFRPFFVRFNEWSSARKGELATTLRKTSFFSFALAFFEQLKSLVTGYASYLLEDAASLLQSLSPTSPHERELLHIVLDALASSFANDQGDFWQSPDHFKPIAEPLICRLQRASKTDATQHIVPAIVELAAAVQSPDLHKEMNRIIMTYMRHEDAAVRLAAVKCERALTDRLHIDWLHLLPEMLAFISELQEDDDGFVERETLRWIHQIEEVTGESLDSMLQ